jgi:hypothetical protein
LAELRLPAPHWTEQVERLSFAARNLKAAKLDSSDVEDAIARILEEQTTSTTTITGGDK